jgi:hypothetical protein
VFIDRGESFDRDGLNMLDSWAKENNIQAIITIVDDIPEELETGTFYIEDGTLIVADKQAAYISPEYKEIEERAEMFNQKIDLNNILKAADEAEVSNLNACIEKVIETEVAECCEPDPVEEVVQETIPEIVQQPVTKWTPSNGNEGMEFESEFCDNCAFEDVDNDRYCAIHTKVIAGKRVEEWVLNSQGLPCCKKFMTKRED